MALGEFPFTPRRGSKKLSPEITVNVLSSLLVLLTNPLPLMDCHNPSKEKDLSTCPGGGQEKVR